MRVPVDVPTVVVEFDPVWVTNCSTHVETALLWFTALTMMIMRASNEATAHNAPLASVLHRVDARN